MPKFKDFVDDYAALWDQAQNRPGHAQAISQAAQKLQGLRPRYDQVSARTNVPWYVVGLIHCLEASFSTTTHLHNGDPLTARTVHVPAGRPKTGSPPFSWEDSAVDALTIEGFAGVGSWSLERIAFQLELYNGWGYRLYHPKVHTPYLWSFTNLYEKGKYRSDGKFDPNLVSDQVGAMALLRELISNGLSVPRAAGGAAEGGGGVPQPPRAVPVETGLYLPDGQPFTLLDGPRDNAGRGIFVLIDMPVIKIEAVDATWWKVQVIAPDNKKYPGFTHGDWLTPQTVPSQFDPEAFGQACLDAARAFGTSAHFLIALAQVESGMSNTGHDGGGFGPFVMTMDDWSVYNDPARTGAGDPDRFDPIMQASVAALMTVKLTDGLRAVLPDRRLPTSEELYLARIFGAVNVPVLITGNQGDAVRDALSGKLSSDDLDRIFASRPTLLTAGVTVSNLRSTVQSRLDEAFKVAVQLVLKVEPDLVLGPPQTTADADVPWMKKAKEELAKHIEEFEGQASNPEIEKYFTDTTLNRQADDVAWCAAFVSWCIKESGGSQKHVVYSARAADWLKNGNMLSGPAYGAVAVTKPYAPTSSGHVGFVTKWDETKVTLLGGNQGNAVCEKQYPIADVRGWRMM